MFPKHTLRMIKLLVRPAGRASVVSCRACTPYECYPGSVWRVERASRGYSLSSPFSTRCSEGYSHPARRWFASRSTENAVLQPSTSPQSYMSHMSSKDGVIINPGAAASKHGERAREQQLASTKLTRLIMQGDLLDAIAAVEEQAARKLNVPTDLWPALIKLCLRRPKYDVASIRRVIALMERLSHPGQCTHSEVTYKQRLFFARETRDWSMLEELIVHIRKHPTVIVSNDFLNAAMCVCARLKARSAFEGFLDILKTQYAVDEYTWRALFLLEHAFANVDGALEVLNQTRSAGFAVTETQWRKLLCICMKAELFDKAYELIPSIVEDCQPTSNTFEVMVKRHIERDLANTLPRLLGLILDVEVLPDRDLCNYIQRFLPSKLTRSPGQLVRISEEILRAYTSRVLEPPYALLEMHVRALSNDHTQTAVFDAGRDLRSPKANSSPISDTSYTEEVKFLSSLREFAREGKFLDAKTSVEDRLRRQFPVPQECWALLLKLCLGSQQKNAYRVNTIVALMDSVAENGQPAHTQSSYGVRLHIAEHIHDASVAEEVAWHMQKYPHIRPSPELLNSAMCICARLADRNVFNQFLQIFKGLHEHDIWTWRALFLLEEQYGNIDGCLQIMNRMRDSGAPVSEILWRRVLDMCVKQCMLQHARELLPEIGKDCQPTSSTVAALVRSHLQPKQVDFLPRLVGVLLDIDVRLSSIVCRSIRERLSQTLTNDSHRLCTVAHGILTEYLSRQLNPPDEILHLELHALPLERNFLKFGTTRELVSWMHQRHPAFSVERLQLLVEAQVNKLPANDFIALFEPEKVRLPHAREIVGDGGDSTDCNTHAELLLVLQRLESYGEDTIRNPAGHFVSKALETEGQLALFMENLEAFLSTTTSQRSVLLCEHLMEQLACSVDPTSASKSLHRRRRLMNFLVQRMVDLVGTPTPSFVRHRVALLIDMGDIDAALDVLEACPASHMDSSLFKNIFHQVAQSNDTKNTARTLLMCVDMGQTLDSDTLELAVKAYLKGHSAYSLLKLLDGVFRNPDDPKVEQVALQVVVWNYFENANYERALDRAQRLHPQQRQHILLKGCELIAGRGNILEALRVYRQACRVCDMPPTVDDCNAILRCCAQRTRARRTSSQSRNVRLFLDDMRTIGLRPTISSWEWAIDILCEGQSLTHATLHALTAADDVQPTMRMYRTVLATLSAATRLDEADEVMRKAHELGWSFGIEELAVFAQFTARTQSAEHTKQLLQELGTRYPNDSVVLLETALKECARRDMVSAVAWLIRAHEKQQRSMSAECRKEVEGMRSFKRLVEELQQSSTVYSHFS